MSRIYSGVLAGVVVLAALAPSAASAHDEMNELEAMFDWWNNAIQQENGFTREGFAKYFTEDAAIIVNTRERVRGLDNMVEHFRRIQASTDEVEIVLPFEEGFEKDNKIFTHHRIRAVTDGVESWSVVMGYAVVEDGRLSLVNFLSYEETG